MANELAGTLIWDLDADAKKFDAALEHSREAASKLKKDVDSHFGSIQSTITKAFDRATDASKLFAGGLLAVGGAMVTGAGFGVKYQAEIETLTQGFVTLLGSTEKANAAIKMIQRDAAQTPFSFKGLVEANAMLTSVTKNADQSERLLLNVGKALTAAGKSGTELDNIIINLQQIANVGKISELDIRQFGFAGINILELLADYYGTTKEAASDMVKNSKNAFADLEAAFVKAGENGGRFSRAFTDQAGTMNQVWSNFQDNLGITASAIVKQTGLFDGLKKALAGVTDALSYFASEKGLAQIMGFLTALKENLPIITGLIVGGLLPAFSSLLKTAIIPMAQSFIALAPFLAIGALIGLAIKLIIDALGGWGPAVEKFNEGIVWLQGKIQPLVDMFKFAFERIGQLVTDFGISGEFGNLRESFAGIAEGAAFYTERALQILADYYQKAKNFLAFGGTEGKASFVDAIQGIYNRIKPFLDELEPVFSKIREQFALTGEIIRTQVAPAFDAFKEAAGPLWEALGPILKGSLILGIKVLASVIGGVIAIALGILTGFLTALANALPYIAQAVEGIIQYFRGMVQLATGLLTGDWALAWEGMKQSVKGAYDFVSNMIMAIIKAISGFVQGVVGFFQALYNTLVGNSIVPDMVNAIVMWFTGMPGRIYEAIVGIVTQVPQIFKDAWSSVTSLVSNWANDVYGWGVNIAKSFADGFSKLGDWLKEKISSGLNSAKKFLEGQSPPVAGPFRNIDLWGENVGRAWVDGLESAINSVSFENPLLPSIPDIAPQPAFAQNRGGGVEKLVNIEHMEVREDSDITEVAREIGFRIETSTGYTDNG